MNNLGSLHIVYKCRKPFRCFDCSKNFEKGSPCYTQNVYEENKSFPVEKKRICMKCGEVQIANGIIVKAKKIKEKKAAEKIQNTKSQTKKKCGNAENQHQ